MHALGLLPHNHGCLRVASPGGGDTQTAVALQRLSRSAFHDLLNQQTTEGRKEMRLINWARKQVSDMADVGSKSIIDVCSLNLEPRLTRSLERCSLHL